MGGDYGFAGGGEMAIFLGLGENWGDRDPPPGWPTAFGGKGEGEAIHFPPVHPPSRQ